MLDSQSQLHRQMRILKSIETRRRYRSWVQAFQLAMLFFFADQILKTYCAGQLYDGEQRSLFGQSLIALTRIPDDGALGAMARFVPRSWEKLPQYLGLGLWLTVLGLLLSRLRYAKFGELFCFALVLSGGLSNLVTRALTTQTFDAFMLQVGRHYLSFNIADVCMIVGSFFLLRSFLLRSRVGRFEFSRSSL